MNKLLIFAVLSLFSCKTVLSSQGPVTNTATTSHKDTPVTDLIIGKLSLNEYMHTDQIALYDHQIELYNHWVKSGPIYATSEGILTFTHTPSEFLIFYNLVPGFVDITAKIYNDGNPDAPASVSSTPEDEFSVCERQSSFQYEEKLFKFFASGMRAQLQELGRTEYLCRASIPAELYLKKMKEFREQHAGTQS
jgi:hypothetical protein